MSNEIRGCSTCKYEKLNFDEDPCSDCCRCAPGDVSKLRWEPKEDPMSKVESMYSPSFGCFPNAVREVVDLNELNKEEKEMSESLIKDDDYIVKRKTKAQLMEELEQKKAEIKELKEALERSETYEQCVEAGKGVREMLDGLVAGGLTEDQAMQIFVIIAGQMVAKAPQWPILK